MTVKLSPQAAANKKAVIKKWKLENPEKLKAQQRRFRERHPGRDRFYRHGVTPEILAAMWTKQDGRCYLCGDPLTNLSEAHIDHDHACCPAGRSCHYCRRGLSCPNCNTAIGHANDDPDRLELIAANLRTANQMLAQRRLVRPTQGMLGF